MRSAAASASRTSGRSGCLGPSVTSDATWKRRVTKVADGATSGTRGASGKPLPKSASGMRRSLRVSRPFWTATSSSAPRPSWKTRPRKGRATSRRLATLPRRTLGTPLPLLSSRRIPPPPTRPGLVRSPHPVRPPPPLLPVPRAHPRSAPRQAARRRRRRRRPATRRAFLSWKPRSPWPRSRPPRAPRRHGRPPRPSRNPLRWQRERVACHVAFSGIPFQVQALLPWCRR